MTNKTMYSYCRFLFYFDFELVILIEIGKCFQPKSQQTKRLDSAWDHLQGTFILHENMCFISKNRWCYKLLQIESLINYETLKTYFEFDKSTNIKK